MNESVKLRIYSSTAYEGDVKAMVKDAVKWHQSLGFEFTPYSSSMRALDEHRIPREIDGVKIQPTRKNQNPSGAQLYIFAQTPTEVSFAPDAPASFLVMDLGLPDEHSSSQLSRNEAEIGFGDFISANDGRIEVVASESELRDLENLTAPDPLPESASKLLKYISGEYEGYGRSLHGSSLSMRDSKESAKELKKLCDSKQISIRQVTFWCWQQGWEGSGVNQLLDFLK